MIHWQDEITALPGIYLQDQEPEGSGVAVSIEPRGAGAWIVHSIKEIEGRAVRHSTKPLPAYAVYKTLDTIYRPIGYVPEPSEAEYDMLQLPPREDIFQQSLANQLPGVFLGVPAEDDEGIGWINHYSVVINDDGTYALYSGVTNEGEDFLKEPEIEKVGTYNLSEILDELRILDFPREKLDFLFTLKAGSLQELKTKLPGAVLEANRFADAGLAVSVCHEADNVWKIFTTERLDRDTYRVHELRDVDARQVDKKIYDLLQTSLAKEERQQAKLPPLEKVYADSIEKKLKGFFLGAVSGEDAAGHYQKRFISLHKEKDEWTLHYVLFEELIAGGRKYAIHKTEPFREETILAFFEFLDPLFDPLDLFAKLQGSKIPEIQSLGDAFQKQMEASG
ncbi:hypothetical protein GF373_05910 [bacterium]|nr:hypothetical protein [bacterium]